MGKHLLMSFFNIVNGNLHGALRHCFSDVLLVVFKPSHLIAKEVIIIAVFNIILEHHEIIKVTNWYIPKV